MLTGFEADKLQIAWRNNVLSSKKKGEQGESTSATMLRMQEVWHLEIAFDVFRKQSYESD